MIYDFGRSACIVVLDENVAGTVERGVVRLRGDDLVEGGEDGGCANNRLAKSNVLGTKI